MLRLVLIFVVVVVVCGGVSADNAEEDAMRLAWAVKRLVGGSCNGSGTSLQSYRPGKTGPVGPPGRPGAIGQKGDQGVCTCDSDEVDGLKQTVRELQNKINSMEAMQPEVFCLLGMKSGLIPDSAISVSSMHSAEYCQITNSRLDHHGAWCAVTNTLGSQWIEVDLGKIQRVTGVVTQGQGNYPNTVEWVTSFKVEYGILPGSRYSVTENGNAKVFSPVNFNKNTKVVSRFQRPIDARYIRIVPASYRSHISMRFDVINC